MTLGVRGVVVERSRSGCTARLCSGWHLPGGGVEIGETLAEALAPPSSYMIGCKQYIVVGAGGNTVIESKRGDCIIAFTIE